MSATPPSPPADHAPGKPHTRAYRVKVPPHYPLLVEVIAELDDPHGLVRRIQALAVPDAVREALSVLTFSEAKNIIALLDTYFAEVLAPLFTRCEIVLWSKSGGRFVHVQGARERATASRRSEKHRGASPEGRAPAKPKAPTLAQFEDAKRFDPKAFRQGAQGVAIARGHYAVPIQAAELCYGALHLFDPHDQAFAPPRLLLAELTARSINGYLKSSRMFEQLLGYERVCARFPKLRISNIAERGIATEVPTQKPHCAALEKDRFIDVRLSTPAKDDDPLRPPLKEFRCRARIVWAGSFKGTTRKLGLHFEPQPDPDRPHAVDEALAAAKELYLWVQRSVAKDRAGR